MPRPNKSATRGTSGKAPNNENKRISRLGDSGNQKHRIRLPIERLIPHSHVVLASKIPKLMVRVEE